MILDIIMTEVQIVMGAYCAGGIDKRSRFDS